MFDSEVLAFFNKNPDKNKFKNGRSSTYLKDKERIIKLHSKKNPTNLLGKGAFGHTKESESNQHDTCVKIQKIKDEKGLEYARKEAEINLDMGVAIGALIEVKKEIVGKFIKK